MRILPKSKNGDVLLLKSYLDNQYGTNSLRVKLAPNDNNKIFISIKHLKEIPNDFRLKIVEVFYLQSLVKNIINVNLDMYVLDKFLNITSRFILIDIHLAKELIKYLK